MDTIVIKVENLSKYYRLGVINSGMLGKDLQSWLWKKFGKEDPNRKIGEDVSDSDGFWALKDLNFEIKQGDRVGIIGKNGAGKSTLLKMLSRISSPTEGRIFIKGKIASLLEVGTGFNPELTGRENIYLNGAILGMKKKEVDCKIDEIIGFSEIEKYIDTPVKRYSSGMYVRLAFAVAAHLDSDILIADEVLAVGDVSFQKKALGKMNELSSGEGRTVLFVSHNMGQVKGLCNKGILLNKGQLVQQGDIKDIISFYVSQSMNNFSTAFKVFPEDKNKDFQMSSIYVVDENGKNLSEFESMQALEIKFTCISRKPIAGLYGYFCIYNSDYQPIIIFDSIEAGDILANLPIGSHTFAISIPAGFLAPGKYIFYANFTSSLNIAGFTVDSPKECCSFSIIDTISRRGSSRGALTSYIPKIKTIL